MIWSALHPLHPSDMEMTVLKCQLYNKAASWQKRWNSRFLAVELFEGCCHHTCWPVVRDHNRQLLLCQRYHYWWSEPSYLMRTRPLTMIIVSCNFHAASIAGGNSKNSHNDTYMHFLFMHLYSGSFMNMELGMIAKYSPQWMYVFIKTYKNQQQHKTNKLLRFIQMVQARIVFS